MTPQQLDMLIEDQKRIRELGVRNFPKMIKEKRITPWERDHRIYCNNSTISLLEKIKNNYEQLKPLLWKTS